MQQITLPRIITDAEAEGMLSSAYSSLKDIHYQLKLDYCTLKMLYSKRRRECERLKEELTDINERYLQLTKLVNNLPENTGL